MEIGSGLNKHRPKLLSLLADPQELKDDLVQDMIEILTSFCARLYGRRSAKNKAKKAVEAIQDDT